MIARSIRLVLLICLGLLAGMGAGEASGLGKLFEGFLAGGGSENGAKEPSATEQLEWVKSRLPELEAQLQVLQSEGFGQRLEAAGWPLERRGEFVALAQRELEAWRSAQTMLEQIILQESLSQEGERPDLPTNEQAADILITRQQAEQARAARAVQMMEGNVRLTAAARQSEREARQNVMLAEEAVAAAGSAEEKTKAELSLELAKLRLGQEEAQQFGLAWNTYSLQLEEKQAGERAVAMARVLDESGFRRLLQKERIETRLALLEKELPEMQKEAEEAVALYQRSSENLQRLQEAVKKEEAGAGQAERRQSLLTRLEENRRLEGGRQVFAHLAEVNAMEQEMIRQLLQALSNGTMEELEKARRLLEGQREELRVARPRLESRMAEVDSTRQALQSELANAALPKGRRAELQAVLAAGDKEKEVLERLFQRVLGLATTQDQLLKELDEQIQARDWSSRVLARLSGLFVLIASGWNFPLLESGGSILTLGRLASGLVALVVALVLSKLLAGQAGRSLSRHFRLPQSQTHVVTTLLYYGLSVVLIFTTLQFLHIPLTIFAFLGGALMVGIGFGSQNLMNNFISGLILLLERKLNVGDLVEADGHLGHITHLGSRCSSIRKLDGVEILVPNSFFLEKNVANWTLSDPEHRFDFTIGLAYGTPVERALQLLDTAVREQKEVLREPAPLVVFESFGDSALVFRIYYWLRIGQGDGRIVGSEIRTRIDRICRENEIEIPFPQREVNVRFPDGAAAWRGPTGS